MSSTLLGVFTLLEPGILWTCYSPNLTEKFPEIPFSGNQVSAAWTD